jgi:hypothetical protein
MWRSHVTMDLFGWQQLQVGDGATARQGEALTAPQRVRQAWPGTTRRVWALARQHRLLMMDREVTPGMAVDNRRAPLRWSPTHPAPLAAEHGGCVANFQRE